MSKKHCIIFSNQKYDAQLIHFTLTPDCTLKMMFSTSKLNFTLVLSSLKHISYTSVSEDRSCLTPLHPKQTCFSFISCTCMAAIIKPITTIVSLSANLFSPPLSVSVCNHRLPALSSDWQPLRRLWSLCLSDTRGSRATALPPLPPSELLLILQSSTSHHRSPPLLQYPAAKPPGLKIELINTFSKYKWDDCLLMDCLSFGSAFKESVW